MGRKKLKRIKELQNNKNIIEFTRDREFNFDIKDVLPINNPIVLELACGSGEYSLFLAKKNPQNSYVGVDIKGPRLWQANNKRIENGVKNITYIRTQIQYIDEIFDNNSISEIWIIHPDPQPKKENKRLTSEVYLQKYKKILKRGGSVFLRTDSKDLFEYTLNSLKNHKIEINFQSLDLVSESEAIKEQIYTSTKYGNLAISKNLPIYFLEFKFNNYE